MNQVRTIMKGETTTVQPRMLNVRQAATYLGISIARLREYMGSGLITGFKYANPFTGKPCQKILIPVEELDRFIRIHTGDHYLQQR